MKLDRYNCLIREKYQPEHHPGNLGDSLAETNRAAILDVSGSMGWVFVHEAYAIAPYYLHTSKHSEHLIGYCRHPLCHEWGNDISSDQLLPFRLFEFIYSYNEAEKVEKNFLPNGTIWLDPDLVSPGLWCAYRKHFKLLNIVNIIQGLLFLFPWRWSDDEKFKGKFWKVERSHGKVQDYLNYICIFIALKRMGKWATLVTPKAKCLAAVKKYYLEGEDFEPNSQWLVDLYERALNEYA